MTVHLFPIVTRREGDPVMAEPVTDLYSLGELLMDKALYAKLSLLSGVHDRDLAGELDHALTEYTEMHRDQVPEMP